MGHGAGMTDPTASELRENIRRSEAVSTSVSHATKYLPKTALYPTEATLVPAFA